MYFNLRDEESFPVVTYFQRELSNKTREGYDGTEVLGTLSDGRRKKDAYGNVSWENDYWRASFRNEAYPLARDLNDGDTIALRRFIIRNRYDKEKKKNYPCIFIYEFDLVKMLQNENE